MYDLANDYDNSRLIIHRCIENALVSPIAGVLNAEILQDGCVAGYFLDDKKAPYSYQLDSEAVYYAPVANSLRADSKGKKCPGGYWIPKKHECKKATMTPSAQRSVKKVRSGLGGNILAATLATAAVAGTGAAVYSAKESYESNKEIKQASERLNEAIANTKGASSNNEKVTKGVLGNSQKIKEVNKRLNEIEKKTKKGGGSLEEMLASGKTPKLIIEVQKEKEPTKSALATTFEKAFPELYTDPTDTAAAVLRTGVLAGAAASPFVGGAVLLKKRVKEEDEEMKKAKEAGKEISRAEARKIVNSKNKVGQLEIKIRDGASNMMKEQAANAVNEIPVVKHVAKPVKATVKATVNTVKAAGSFIEEASEEGKKAKENLENAREIEVNGKDFYGDETPLEYLASKAEEDIDKIGRSLVRLTGKEPKGMSIAERNEKGRQGREKDRERVRELFREEVPESPLVSSTESPETPKPTESRVSPQREGESSAQYAKRQEEKRKREIRKNFVAPREPGETFWQYAGRKGKGDFKATGKALLSLINRNKNK